MGGIILLRNFDKHQTTRCHIKADSNLKIVKCEFLATVTLYVKYADVSEEHAAITFNVEERAKREVSRALITLLA
jgi:hypothetical protein